jgi:hypothetical protein
MKRKPYHRPKGQPVLSMGVRAKQAAEKVAQRRARLQPCRPGLVEMRALAAEVRLFPKVRAELFSITVFQFRWRLQQREISGRKS